MNMAEERKIVSHGYIRGKFKCACGKEVGVEHVITFSDGTTKKECNACFIFDEEALDAGLVDMVESFILQNPEKKADFKNAFGCTMLMPLSF